MSLLILSRSENVHADVVERICRKHTHVNRMNFDFDTTGKIFPKVEVQNLKPADRPDAVFVHHPRVSCPEDWFDDEIERKLFIASWDSVKEWMEADYHQAQWVNRPSANYASKNVLRQLGIAASLGLNTPKTIFTNDAEKLRDFAGDDTVVVKQGNLGVHIENKTIFTSVVDQFSITNEMLQGSPCLFQKYTPKAYELRVHVIGTTVLTCKIDSQANEKTRIDWRNYDIENTPHEPYQLDLETELACIKLTQNLGLEFGIIDMIVTSQGENVFLECNAQGHWYWIEELTGLPITENVCALLTRSSA